MQYTSQPLLPDSNYTAQFIYLTPFPQYTCKNWTINCAFLYYTYLLIYTYLLYVRILTFYYFLMLLRCGEGSTSLDDVYHAFPAHTTNKSLKLKRTDPSLSDAAEAILVKVNSIRDGLQNGRLLHWPKGR